MITNEIVLNRVQALIEALEANMASRGGSATARYASYTLDNKKSAKYHRIVMHYSSGGGSVHAFVDANGLVYKSAGWTAPAKGARYDLLNDESFEAILKDATWSGGYLYAGAQSYSLPKAA
jgi:hypothetical protein